MGIALQFYGADSSNTVSFHHKFSCDKAGASKAIIALTDPSDRFDKDILKRNIAELTAEVGCGNLSLYSFTSPCQGLSLAGKQGGAKDSRTQLVFSGILAVQKLKPHAFILENVSALCKLAKFRKLFQFIVKQLETAGYKVEHNVLNSAPYTAQNRSRLYMVGIRNDKVRTQLRGVPLFPADVPVQRSISDCVVPLPPGQWKLHPDPKSDSLGYTNVMAAYKSLEESGTNPFITPCVIDGGSSPKFQNFRIGGCPTLTHTRASAGRYWCSTKGGYLTVDEMAELQGFSKKEFPWREAGLTPSAAGALLGNAQTLSLLKNLIPHVMFHASLCDFSQFSRMKEFLRTCQSGSAP